MNLMNLKLTKALALAIVAMMLMMMSPSQTAAQVVACPTCQSGMVFTTCDPQNAAQCDPCTLYPECCGLYNEIPEWCESITQMCWCAILTCTHCGGAGGGVICQLEQDGHYCPPFPQNY